MHSEEQTKTGVFPEFLRALRVFVANFAPQQRRQDHREAVGGMWDVIGRLQLDFMKGQGLKPEHRLLDIGCGSLRAGRFFIEYLKAGGYLGLDVDEALVKDGLLHEVDPKVVEEKRPGFAFNYDFNFSFDEKPDFALAQSVFTHLTPDQMRACLNNLRAFAPKCIFYVTFNESAFDWPAVFWPNTQRTFFYTRRFMDKIANECGWTMTYIGDWGHPRNQRILRLTARPSATAGGPAN